MSFISLIVLGFFHGPFFLYSLHSHLNIQIEIGLLQLLKKQKKHSSVSSFSLNTADDINKFITANRIRNQFYRHFDDLINKMTVFWPSMLGVNCFDGCEFFHWVPLWPYIFCFDYSFIRISKWWPLFVIIDWFISNQIKSYFLCEFWFFLVSDLNVC